MGFARWLVHVERDGVNTYRSIYLFGARVELTLWGRS
jgi:hypothetical protein